MRASRVKKLAVLSKELVVLAIEAIQARDDKPEATIHEVLRLIARNDNNEEREVIIPDGRFATIVINPPWDMQKIEREVRPNQVGFDYPTMTKEELINWSLARDKAADDCHLFMWTTQKWRRAAEQIIEAWGFEVHEMFVWHKPGGFQPVNRPQYNCEFVVYASLGTPVFIDTTGFNCCFEAPRREHSRKPDEFYDLIKRVTPGPRIDMFARGPHDGFALHGNGDRAICGISYAVDRPWSDRHLSTVRTLVGPHLLINAPLERDKREATDLIVLLARNMTIAVRLRRRSAGYWRTFGDQFTIRCERDSGTMTELAKIVNGWGNWLFYGHANDLFGVYPWMLVNLNSLRALFIRKPDLLHRPDGIRSGRKSNGDGTHFMWFATSQLPADVIIATGGL